MSIRSDTVAKLLMQTLSSNRDEALAALKKANALVDGDWYEFFKELSDPEKPAYINRFELAVETVGKNYGALTPIEKQFFDNVSVRVRAGVALSQRQEAWLLDLVEKVK